MFPNKDPAKINLTDSELIAIMLGKELDNTADLKTAITNIVEKKLIGTWRLAIIPVNNPNMIYFTKNCGDFFIGKSPSSVLICTSADARNDLSEHFSFQKMKNNILYEITDSCAISQSLMTRKIVVDKTPGAGFSHIFEKEIYGQLEAIESVTDRGSKFISNH